MTYLWLVRFAHSRGFCIGEYGDFKAEGVLLQLLTYEHLLALICDINFTLKYQKYFPSLPHRSITVFKVFAISQEIRDIFCICSICYISCIWEISSIRNTPKYTAKVMIFTEIVNFGINKNIWGFVSGNRKNKIEFLEKKV